MVWSLTAPVCIIISDLCKYLTLSRKSIERVNEASCIKWFESWGRVEKCCPFTMHTWDKPYTKLKRTLQISHVAWKSIVHCYKKPGHIIFSFFSFFFFLLVLRTESTVMKWKKKHSFIPVHAVDSLVFYHKD